MEAVTSRPLDMRGVRTKENGVLLDGSRNALRRLGLALEEGLSATFELARSLGASPDEELRKIRLEPAPSPDEPVLLRSENDSLIIHGGRNKAAMLGRGFINLASSPSRVTPTSVPTHLDIEHYETHAYLAPSKVWLNVWVQEDE
jgi:hypothetical protein